jgi:hypothetical protein
MMTNNEIKAELERLAARLAEQERITADLDRRVTALERKAEGNPKTWGVLWPGPQQGGQA